MKCRPARRRGCGFMPAPRQYIAPGAAASAGPATVLDPVDEERHPWLDALEAWAAQEVAPSEPAGAGGALPPWAAAPDSTQEAPGGPGAALPLSGERRGGIHDLDKLWYAGIDRDEDGAIVGGAAGVGLREGERGLGWRMLNAHRRAGYGGEGGFNGAEQNLTMAHVEHDPARTGESGFWGHLSTFSLDSAFYHDSSGCSVGGECGGELGLASDLVAFGAGGQIINGESGADRGLKVGLGIGGPGLGLRWSQHDADEDGRPEYGLGVTAPLDRKSVV